MLTHPPLLSILKSATDKKYKLSIPSETTINDAIKIGLGPTLFYTLKNIEQQHQPENHPHLLASELTSKIITNNYLETLKVIFGCCNENLLKNIILLKGISIALLYYPKAHMRTMADIDILIDKKFEKELESICLSLGFKQKSDLPKTYYDSLHHSMPLYHSEKNIWIEIHTALFPSHHTVSYEDVFSIENIFSNTFTSNIDEYKIRHLTPELQLIYTSSHWAQEHNWMKSLMRILDMIYIINNKEKKLNWSLLKSWQGDTISTAQLYLILSLLDKHGLVYVPNDFLQLLLKKQKTLNKLNTYILHKIIVKHAFENRLFGKLLSENLISLIWRSLILSKKPPLVNLFFILPWYIIFPPKNKNRFSLSFQMKRILNLFKGVLKL